MEITLDPTARAIAELLCSTDHPRERLAQAQDLLRPPVAGQPRYGAGFSPFEVMEAAMRDGYDWRAAQQVFGLFSPARKIRASVWALEQFAMQQVEQRARAALLAAAQVLEPAWRPKRILLAILPADPSNRNLMIRNSGMSSFGEAERVCLTFWPSPGNLARFEAVLVRAFALGCYWAATNAAEHYRLADALHAEGYAANIVAACYPQIEAPWLVAHTAPPVWAAELAAVAALYGVANYAQVPANLYGRSEERLLPFPPIALPLDPEEFAYSQAILADHATSNDARVIAACLYGDAIIAEQGHPQFGLSPYAGLEVAYRS
ncbi:MAG: hypothetical protein Fur005_41260 [Roseiflexaceae bacterium]